jgi:PPM family protein phosphatase
MRFEAEGVTDVGRRREGNEDGMLVNDDLGLLAVADGMGGHRGGEVASATALESLRASVASGMAIREAIQAANDAVLERAADDPALSGMGTTLTAGTLAAGDTLILGHVGDSRAYLLRDGELRQLTEDHSLVEEMVRDGRLTREQAEHHPQRSVITRALGVEAGVDVDVDPIDLQAGDRLLLCSDGLTTMVPADLIADVLTSEPDPGVAAGRLIQAANAAGGDDNITAVVADFVPDAAPAGRPVVPAAAAGAGAPLTRKERRREARKARPRRRRLVRALLIVLPVLAILGIGFAATAWYARSSYFVGLDGSTVTVYRGLPDGLLFWDPTVEETTDLEAGDLTEAQQSDLESGKKFSSKSDAEDYVARLEASVDDDGGGGGQQDDRRDQRNDRNRNRNQNRNRAGTSTTTTTTTAPAPAP